MTQLPKKAFSIKLDEANFSTWKKEALEEIQARKVEKFTTEAPETKDGGRPRMFRSARDENLQKINTEYRKWDQQDQVVYRWLLASISPELGTRMVGCQRAFQIWKKIEAFCLQKECEKLRKHVKTLEDENSMLQQRLKNLAEECCNKNDSLERLKNLAEECLEVNNEIDAIEKELIEKYGAEAFRI
ncbi:uncharacterized protein LOC114915994 [Cajanus cajan]|uniref:uncharacterized protein LOC114915994 n=1 Tax=Cajanus cajan TaxID=3821 RepID=UPI0010FB91F1|nr:uncharacterized protein LOC114915994 [Cajanus cajan]